MYRSVIFSLLLSLFCWSLVISTINSPATVIAQDSSFEFHLDSFPKGEYIDFLSLNLNTANLSNFPQVWAQVLPDGKLLYSVSTKYRSINFWLIDISGNKLKIIREFTDKDFFPFPNIFGGLLYWRVLKDNKFVFAANKLRESRWADSTLFHDGRSLKVYDFNELLAAIDSHRTPQVIFEDEMRPRPCWHIFPLSSDEDYIYPIIHETFDGSFYENLYLLDKHYLMFRDKNFKRHDVKLKNVDTDVNVLVLPNNKIAYLSKDRRLNILDQQTNKITKFYQLPKNDIQNIKLFSFDHESFGILGIKKIKEDEYHMVMKILPSGKEIVFENVRSNRNYWRPAYSWIMNVDGLRTLAISSFYGEFNSYDVKLWSLDEGKFISSFSIKNDPSKTRANDRTILYHPIPNSNGRFVLVTNDGVISLMQ